MKQELQQLLTGAILIVQQKMNLSFSAIDDIQIERTRDQAHGDFACNIAMVLAKQANINPRQLASSIVENLPDSEIIDRVEIAGPGFINFFLNKQSLLNVITKILQAGENYGRSEFGSGETILVEFVSANPTGPLHIGHGRGAAYGAVVSDLLEAIGYKVDREYYVNDAGRQMDILTISIWLRYLQRCGIKIGFPENAYQGDYILEIADKMFSDKQQALSCKMDPPRDILKGCEETDDPETKMDQLIAISKSTLGSENYQSILDLGLNEILDVIRKDLADFGVVFDRWFFERTLSDDKKIQKCIDRLKESNFVYEENGALWFRSTAFGDKKDRVITRENGQTTYFASDIAYHLEKFSRGYDRAINIWGADHHGYIARVKAALSALNENPDALEILLVQFATLYRGTEKLQMSTRSGQFVTLKELRDEVGKDATRFFYIMRKSEQHLDFDLELAKSKSNENPVYYIQYAHARICSVLKQVEEKGLSYNVAVGNKNLHTLTEPSEEKLITALSRYPEIVQAAAKEYEPHQLAYYLKDLANEFHSYYNSCQFIVDSAELRNARLNLICASKQVIANGLGILGVSAPEQM
ncbi:MAG: arginine--tRNA ligase [Gammaproteobacteria bacterium]|nr:MAG: arginine--tRNA ligase [Gammaproteobacteria bacterium]